MSILRDPAAFRAALFDEPAQERDAWLDRVLGLAEIPDDDPELPTGCVPYLPCSVDALVRAIDQASIGPSDVVVDVGSGIGRAAAFLHLMTGASVIGLEIQRRLVDASRALAARLHGSRLRFEHGDAADLAPTVPSASVFFLYCPFSGRRLAKLVAGLEHVARARPIRVCCVDLPLPPRSWLAADAGRASDVTVYRSVCSHAK